MFQNLKIEWNSVAEIEHCVVCFIPPTRLEMLSFLRFKATFIHDLDKLEMFSWTYLFLTSIKTL